MELEVGKTYEFKGWPPGDVGRKALVLSDMGGCLYGIRWPNGMEAVKHGRNFKGPVEAAVPGVDERCLACQGEEVVDVLEPKEGESWVSVVVGEKPCPNCCASQ